MVESLFTYDMSSTKRCCSMTILLLFVTLLIFIQATTTTANDSHVASSSRTNNSSQTSLDNHKSSSSLIRGVESNGSNKVLSSRKLQTDGVVSFTLYNALTNAPIRSNIQNNDVINLVNDRISLNLVAEFTNSDAVGSVRFTTSSDDEKIENMPPYALCGDSDGDYFDCASSTFPTNNTPITVSVQAYTDRGGMGAIVVPSTTITFAITASSSSSSSSGIIIPDTMFIIPVTASPTTPSVIDPVVPASVSAPFTTTSIASIPANPETSSPKVPSPVLSPVSTTAPETKPPVAPNPLPLATTIKAPTLGSVSGSVVISEVMASNKNTIADRDGDFEDYLEIHNTGSGPISLSGYTLTDDVENPTQWIFPDELPALDIDEYLLVFCSGKEYRYDPSSANGRELHTNFKLSADGEYLGLYRPGNEVEYEYTPSYPPQLDDDVSFGINDNGVLTYFNIPTPGAPNRGPGDFPPAGKVSMSVARGFYTSEFTVVLASDTSNAQIRYTTDGSEPTSTNGLLYNGNVRIETTTTLRARAFAINRSDSDVETVSYIFLQDVIQQPAQVDGFPNGLLRDTGNNGPVPLDMEMDPDVVNSYRSEIIESLQSIPTMSITADIDDLFGDNNGLYVGNDDVEHRVSMEVLYANDSDSNEQIDCGLQAHSHDRLKRSLRLDFRRKYGTLAWKTNLLRDTPFNAKPDGARKVSNEFRTLVLRAGNNRSWARAWNPDATAYTIDQFYRMSQVALSEIGSHGTFVHLYMNGIYWGLYNPVERPDENFGAEYVGGDNDDWFFTNHGNAGNDDRTRWDYITGGLLGKNMANTNNYAQFKEHVDVEGFADYLILSFYIGLTDWPNNNWFVIHRQPDSQDGSTPAQFIAWDGEWSFDRRRGSAGNGGATVYQDFKDFDGSGGADIVQIWRAAYQSPEFRATFADRVFKATTEDGALSDAVALARWDEVNEFIESAVVGESARWGDALRSLGGDKFDVTRTRDIDWRDEVAVIRNIISGNSQQLIDVLVDSDLYADISPPVVQGGNGFVRIENPSNQGTIRYTTDKSNPAGPSGQVYSVGTRINLSKSTDFRAVIVQGSLYSAITEFLFLLPTFDITKVYCDPADPFPSEVALGFESKDFEFIELENISSGTLNANDLYITSGVEANPGSRQIATGEVVRIVANVDAYRERFGTTANVVGEFTDGSLNDEILSKIHWVFQYCQSK